MNGVSQLIGGYVFIIPLIVLVLSELAKVLIESFRRGESILNGHWLGRLFHPGGFPSTHSALVTSLIIIVEQKQGIHSTEFAIAFVLACIVWYDAMTVRRNLGDHAEILNRLQRWKHFSERLGHSLLEVLGGIAFGAIVTMLGIAVLS